MSPGQLSPELRALLRKHPLPKRTEGDRILRGDLVYGAARYAAAASEGGPSELWQVFLALESELGNDPAQSAQRLSPEAQLGFARWCFASGRVDVGIETFQRYAEHPSAVFSDDDVDEYLAQVEATHGKPALIAAADALLPTHRSQRVLHTCVQALSAMGDIVGAQSRLAEFGDASSTMAGFLRAEDLNLVLPASEPGRPAPPVEAVGVQAPAAQTPGAQAPRVDVPRGEAPRVQAPPVEAARAHLPRADVPRVAVRPTPRPMPRVKEAAPTAKTNHPVIGQLVGGTFQIQGFVSEGRIAQVFSAMRESAPRHVALKVLLPTFAEDPQIARRFLRAAELSKNLDHPGIVPVFAAGEDRGWLYVASGMVFGENLDSYVQTRGALRSEDALRIATEVTRALEHALSRGVTHRGLRPSNVLLVRNLDSPEVEHVRVADFGMAEIVEALQPLDGYTSPEQAHGEVASPASDVYGVGALLYKLVTGHAPFSSFSPSELRRAIVAEPLEPPANANELSPKLLSLIERALRKDPAQRYPTVKELAKALAEASAIGFAQPSTEAPVAPVADRDQTQTRLHPAQGAPQSPQHPLVGQVLDGRFRVVSFMRSGGMAQLYYGTQAVEPHRVAIKVMHPVFAAEPEIVKRFAREAKLAARLDHPNIVRLIHVGADPRLLYIAMEILSGEDLSVRIKQRGRLAEAQTAEIAIDVTNALAYAHALGVVHRDIKPANVMMCTGEARDVVKLLDFGIAKVLDKSSNTMAGSGLTVNRSAITSVGDLVGTPRYMAPEQGRAEPVDHRADLYSLGVVLYELVTGVVPFDGETALQIIARHVQEPPRPPSQLAHDLHPDLDRLILDLLKKDPRKRPSSAAEVRQKLEALLPHLAVSPATSTHRWMERPISSPRPRGPNTEVTRPRELEPLTKPEPIEPSVQRPLAPPLRTMPMQVTVAPPSTEPQLPPAPAPALAATANRPIPRTMAASTHTARMIRDQVMQEAQRYMVIPAPPVVPPSIAAAAIPTPPNSADDEQRRALAAQVARLNRMVQLLIAIVVLLAAAVTLIVALR